MANAALDQNSRATLTAVSSSDGTTIVTLYADPTTHRLLTQSAGATTSGAWGSGGDTVTITDANVSAISFISIMHTQVPNGFWKITPGAGSFIITSSDAENNGLTFKYKILS